MSAAIAGYLSGSMRIVGGFRFEIAFQPIDLFSAAAATSDKCSVH